jgi:hypothetical protein
MLSQIESAWLAGFADADGSIRLKKGAKNEKKGQNSLIPHITFHNTCVMTCNRIVELVVKVIPEIKTTARKRSSKEHALCAGIEVYGMKRCEPLLRELLPYLATKRVEAELMLKFIERRKAREHRNKPYESEDYRIYEAIKYLKKSRHLRDYMPSIEEILDEDIVRTNAKALEEAEMTSRLSEEERSKFAATLVWYRKDRSKG